ncbi:MAG: FAD-dependent monooxygenase [Gammaproteobacteria bacterium]|nr:FAD-dependent monooxygenase [Gammaproteobacteria bacterium]
MKIAILGGGVAGVSSAIALKLKGFDVSVYERCDSASNIGAGIVVWPNAAYVLEQLGVLSENRSRIRASDKNASNLQHQRKFGCD